MNKKTLSKITESIKFHEEMKNAYFWKPPSSAAERRTYEKENSYSYQFIRKGEHWAVNHSTECSCKNIYYKLTVECEGESKTIRDLKKMIKVAQ